MASLVSAGTPSSSRQPACSFSRSGGPRHLPPQKYLHTSLKGSSNDPGFGGIIQSAAYSRAVVDGRPSLPKTGHSVVGECAVYPAARMNDRVRSSDQSRRITANALLLWAAMGILLLLLIVVFSRLGALYDQDYT